MYDLLLWIIAKLFNPLIVIAVLSIGLGITAVALGKPTYTMQVRRRIQAASRTALIVISIALLILLVDSTVGRQIAQWALYTLFALPFVGLFGAIFDGRWLALAALFLMSLVIVLLYRSPSTIDTNNSPLRYAKVARVLLIIGVTSVVVSFMLPSDPVSEISSDPPPLLTSHAHGTFEANPTLHGKRFLQVQEFGHRLKLSFLGGEHPESIVSSRRLYQSLQSQGAFSRSLPYVEEALRGAEAIYGPDSVEKVRHQMAKLQVQLLQGRFSEAGKLTQEIVPRLDDPKIVALGSGCSLKLELAGIFSATGNYLEVPKLMEGLLTDPVCPLSADSRYRDAAFIAYARFLMWGERYQEAHAVLSVAAQEKKASGKIRDSQRLGLMMALADLEKATGDHIDAFTLEEVIFKEIRRTAPPNGPRLIYAQIRLSEASVNAGYALEGLELLNEVLPRAEIFFGAGGPLVVRAQLIKVRALRRLGAFEASLELAESLLLQHSHNKVQTLLSSQIQVEFIASLYSIGRFQDLENAGERMLETWPLEKSYEKTEALRYRREAYEIAKYVAMSQSWSGRLLDSFNYSEAIKRDWSHFSRWTDANAYGEIGIELMWLDEQLASAHVFPELRAHLEAKREELVTSYGQATFKKEDYEPFEIRNPRILLDIVAALDDHGGYASFLVTAEGTGIVFLIRKKTIDAYPIEIPSWKLGMFHEYLRNQNKEISIELIDMLELSPDLFPFLDDPHSSPMPEKLVVSADAGLREVPFEALRFNREFLLSSVAFSYTNHAEGWLRAKVLDRSISPARGMLVIGDPAYSSQKLGEVPVRAFGETALAESYRMVAKRSAGGGRAWDRLPGSRKEIETLREVWGPEFVSVLSDSDANADEVVRALVAGGGKYKYIVFSTHGFSSAVEPEVSALVLAPRPEIPETVSVLSAARLRNLELEAELVFLSACDTDSTVGFSVGGPMGLPRAFRDAGVRRVVATLWPIRDDVAPEITGKFFDEVAEGASYADALADAKRHVMAMDGAEHPYFWAGFFLYEESL